MISGRWFNWERVWSISKDAASVLGLFSVLIAVVGFFPSLNHLIEPFQQRNFLFLLVLVSLIYGAIKNRPKNEFAFQIHNRDAHIALRVGDIDKINAAYVVPVNSEFDMNLNGSVRTSCSVKSMVINRYFAGNHDSVQKKVSKELRSKLYATQKENGKYKLGTTVRLELDSREKCFYFVVNSHKVNDSRVEANERGLSQTLSGLWSFISSNGAKGDIAIPLLGTGNGRLKIPRQEVYKEIVRSFIASCASKNYCNRMTIVIRDEDVTKYRIDIEELAEFTKLQTQYANFPENLGPTVGQPVS